MAGPYPNRTDLQNSATANYTGQTYGEASSQERSQQQVRPGAPPTEQQAQQVAGRIRPGAKPLGRASERPTEPITAGAPFGAGPGPLQTGMRPRFLKTNRTIEQLEALMMIRPSPGLEALLAKAKILEAQGRLRGK